KDVRDKIELLAPPKESFSKNQQNLQLTKQAERALKTTFLEAKLFKNATVNTVHLLLCILRNENDPVTKLLKKLDIDYTSVKKEFQFQFQEDDITESPKAESSSYDDDDDRGNEFEKATPKSNTKTKT